MVAPLTVSVADCPVQIEVLGDIVNVILLTVTVTCAVAVQPLLPVPVTVYVVVEEGLAETLAPVVLLRPVGGDHEYVFAPLAVNAAGCPLQIAVLGETVIATVVTVTVTCAVAVHPLLPVPVTVYVVVDSGLAVTDEPVDELRFVEGVHV